MSIAAGFYGKLPELGDFVQQDLPQSFIDAWDNWLQEAISISRDQLGDAWLNYYLNSPIWRFALSAGVCGDSPWSGVIMPSVDRVGRYFPLTIAAPLPLDANLCTVAIDGASWFLAAEEIILSALSETEFDRTEFEARVKELSTLMPLEAHLSAPSQQGYGTAWRLPLEEEGVPDAALSLLAHQSISQRLSAYTLWWGQGSEHVQPSMLVCDGLPLAADFAAMLAGNWESGSWENWSPAELVEQAG